MKLEKPDLWPKRARFRELVDAERERLGMQADHYWMYLAGILGLAPRSVRALYTDRNQPASFEVIRKAAEHFRVQTSEIAIPSAADRKRIMAEYAANFMPPMPVIDPPLQEKKPRQERQIVLNRPPNAERLALLGELKDKLDRLELPHLKFIDHLLQPYWGLFTDSFR